jgi:hypothetical protein
MVYEVKDLGKMILKKGSGYSNLYGMFSGRAVVDTQVTVTGEGRHAQEVKVRFDNGTQALVQRRFLMAVAA